MENIMNHRRWDEQFLTNRIAYILFHAGLIPRKKAPSPDSFNLLAFVIMQQKYKSIIRDILVKTVLQGSSVKIRPSKLRIINAMMSISYAMALHGRQLEEAHPEIEDEPDREEPHKTRSGG